MTAILLAWGRNSSSIFDVAVALQTAKSQSVGEVVTSHSNALMADDNSSPPEEAIPSEEVSHTPLARGPSPRLTSPAVDHGPIVPTLVMDDTSTDVRSASSVSGQRPCSIVLPSDTLMLHPSNDAEGTHQSQVRAAVENSTTAVHTVRDDDCVLPASLPAGERVATSSDDASLPPTASTGSDQRATHMQGPPEASVAAPLCIDQGHERKALTSKVPQREYRRSDCLKACLSYLEARVRQQLHGDSLNEATSARVTEALHRHAQADMPAMVAAWPDIELLCTALLPSSMTLTAQHIPTLYEDNTIALDNKICCMLLLLVVLDRNEAGLYRVVRQLPVYARHLRMDGLPEVTLRILALLRYTSKQDLCKKAAVHSLGRLAKHNTHLIDDIIPHVKRFKMWRRNVTASNLERTCAEVYEVLKQLRETPKRPLERPVNTPRPTPSCVAAEAAADTAGVSEPPNRQGALPSSIDVQAEGPQVKTYTAPYGPTDCLTPFLQGITVKSLFDPFDCFKGRSKYLAKQGYVVSREETGKDPCLVAVMQDAMQTELAPIMQRFDRYAILVRTSEVRARGMLGRDIQCLYVLQPHSLICDGKQLPKDQATPLTWVCKGLALPSDELWTAKGLIYSDRNSRIWSNDMIAKGKTPTMSEEHRECEKPFNPRDISIVSWNVNGLRSILKKDKFWAFLAEQQADIVCISESRWAWKDAIKSKHFLSKLKAFGYVSVTWHQCKRNAGYAGVVVLSKILPSSSSATRSPVQKGIGIPEIDEEGRVITLEFESFVLVHTYAACSGNKFKFEGKRRTYDEGLCQHLRKWGRIGKPLVWTGDLNVVHRKCDMYITDLAEAERMPGCSKIERSRFETIRMEHGMKDVYLLFHSEEKKNHYTWFKNDYMRKRGKGLRLDYFCVGRTLCKGSEFFPGGDAPYVEDMTVLTTQRGSDHLPVKLWLKNALPSPMVSPQTLLRQSLPVHIQPDKVTEYGEGEEHTDIKLGCLTELAANMATAHTGEGHMMTSTYHDVLAVAPNIFRDIHDVLHQRVVPMSGDGGDRALSCALVGEGEPDLPSRACAHDPPNLSSEEEVISMCCASSTNMATDPWADMLAAVSDTCTPPRLEMPALASTAPEQPRSPMPECEGRVEGRTVKCLFDSGALKCLADITTIQRVLGTSYESAIEEDTPQKSPLFRFADGRVSRSKGRVTLPVSFRSRGGTTVIVNVSMWLMDNCPYDIIIGNDAMKAAGCVIDLRNDVIQVQPHAGGPIHKLSFGQSDNIPLHADKDVMVPAQSELLIMATANDVTAKGFVTMAPTKHLQVQGPYGITALKRGRTPYMVANESSKPMLLRKGQVVALARSHSKDDFQIIRDPLNDEGDVRDFRHTPEPHVGQNSDPLVLNKPSIVPAPCAGPRPDGVCAVLYSHGQRPIHDISAKRRAMRMMATMQKASQQEAQLKKRRLCLHVEANASEPRLASAAERVPVNLMEMSPTDDKLQRAEGDARDVASIPHKACEEHSSDPAQDPASFWRELDWSRMRSDMGNKWVDELLKLLIRHKVVFARDASEFGLAKGITATLRMRDGQNTKPHCEPIRSVNPMKRKIIEEEVDRLLNAGICEQSNSEWRSAIMLVPKKEPGQFRMCIDFRGVNKALIDDANPLPKVQDIMDNLKGAKYFSKLDILAAFHTIPLSEESKQYTAFATPSGRFVQYTRLPFGLKNATAIMQRFSTKALGDLLWRCAVVYVDDFLIWSPSKDQHLKDIDAVLSCMEKAGLRAKVSKCDFGLTSIPFLGHIISEEGCRPDPVKVRAILDVPRPSSLDSLRSWMGMCGYYRKYIKNYSRKVHPLLEMAKKGQRKFPKPDEWNAEQVEAWNFVREQLTTEPILTHPRWEDDWFLYTDASKKGLGATLAQKVDGVERVVAFASRVLTKSEKQYSVHQLEALAMMWGLEVFRHYLQPLAPGQKATVVTDHQALRFFQDMKEPGRYARWIMRLQDFKFDIVHRPGRKHGNCDGTSRNPLHVPPGAYGEAVVPALYPEGGGGTDGLQQAMRAMKQRIGNSQALSGDWSEPILLTAKDADVSAYAQCPVSEREICAAMVMPSHDVADALVATRAARRRMKQGGASKSVPNPAVTSPKPSSPTDQTQDVKSSQTDRDVKGSDDHHHDCPHDRKDPAANGDASEHQRLARLMEDMRAAPADTPWLHDKIREQQLLDPHLARMRTILQRSDVSVSTMSKPDMYVRNNFEIRRDIVCKKIARKQGWKGGYRSSDGPAAVPVIPPSLRTLILKLHHGTPLAGHGGRNKVMAAIHNRFWWKGLSTDVRKWIKGCLLCARRKGVRPLRAGSARTMISPHPFHTVAIDFVTNLPNTPEEEDCILTMVDTFTRWPIAIPLSNRRAETVADAIYRHLICEHGIPMRILSDRGKEFMSKVVKQMCDRLGIRKIQTSGWSPWANGHVERMHRGMMAQLTCLLRQRRSGRKVTEWSFYLPAVLFALRTSVHDSTGYSPYYLVYGREPMRPVDALMRATREGEVGESHDLPDRVAHIVRNMDEAYEAVRHLQSRLAEQNRLRRDENRYEVAYQPGDLVLYYEASKRNAEGPVGEPKGPKKLQHRFTGPHRVVRRLSNTMFQLEKEPWYLAADAVKEFAASVTRIIPYTPWSDDVLDTSVMEHEPVHQDVVPPTVHTDAGEDEKHQHDETEAYRQSPVGDLVLFPVQTEFDDDPPFMVGKLLERQRVSGGESQLLIQLYGNSVGNLTGAYRPGWYSPSDKKCYYRHAPISDKDTEYTNVITKNKLTDWNICLNGFSLTKSDRLPSSVWNSIIRSKWIDYGG